MSEDNVNRILEILDEVNARENAQKFVETFCDKAKNNFGNLQLRESAKSDMNDVIEFMAGRNY
jgi:geranylgeranyl pyrophosphate synthase